MEISIDQLCSRCKALLLAGDNQPPDSVEMHTEQYANRQAESVPERTFFGEGRPAALEMPRSIPQADGE